MRTLLLILLVGLVAGCASNNGGTNGNTTTTTPTTGGNSTMMMTQIKSDTHDFSTCAAPPPTPVACAASTAITVPSTYSMFNLTVKWSTSTPAPGAVVQGVQVKVGSLTCTIPDGPFTGATPCNKQGTITPAPTKIEYSGAGPVTATVTLSGS